ncbi:MAG: hypothetical protein O2954_19745 [bacterium]|nr:hypothetical protein [bacterium]
MSKYHRFFKHYNNPDTHISGPDLETIQVWDQLCQSRKLVAIGGVDAHARKYPLLPFVVFPYEYLFRNLRTYFLLDQPLTGNAEQDISSILYALREGHCFIAYDRLAKGAGTRFGSTDGILQMGDECTFKGPLELEVRLPAQAELLILRNGRPFLHTRNKTFAFRAETPGVYRVEARRDGKPWIFTNPIYLRPGAGSL